VKRVISGFFAKQGESIPYYLLKTNYPIPNLVNTQRQQSPTNLKPNSGN
jgi:hypothetical protein